jgi:hypothetical protein
MATANKQYFILCLSNVHVLLTLLYVTVTSYIVAHGGAAFEFFLSLLSVGDTDFDFAR